MIKEPVEFIDDKTLKNCVSHAIKKHKRKHGIPIRQMSIAMGQKDHSQLNLMSRGKKLPSLRTFINLCRLGIEFDFSHDPMENLNDLKDIL